MLTYSRLTDAFRRFDAIQFDADPSAFDASDHERRGPDGIEVSPAEAVIRCARIADGISVALVEAPADERLEVAFEADLPTLVVYEHGTRREGESVGLAGSKLRDLGRKLSVVPAGHRHRERLEPQTPARIMYVQIDPDRLPHVFHAGGANTSLPLRMVFEDAALLDAALKLKRTLEAPGPASPVYLEALGIVLVHELIRASRDAPRSTGPARGGLAAWQQRTVTAYIDAHLDETISLATLAKLARLSPYHFCRAFKQSLGVPPHRYHTARRIERAKARLSERTSSVTEIGMAVGYSETSSFTAAFRKATGLTPTAWQRSLG